MDVTKQAIRIQLQALGENTYQEFSSKLIPGSKPMIGVRIPKLRDLAKKIAKECPEEYLSQASNELFEEVALHSYVIGYMKTDIETTLKLVADFIPMIDNWSICDGFCATLKVTNKFKERVWDFLKPYIASESEFEVRFAAIMLMDYYLTDDYIEDVLKIYDTMKLEDYYSKMGVAWGVATSYAKYPEKTYLFLEWTHLDDWTYNKSIQKMLESNRVDIQNKNILRTMKRK